MNPVIIGIDGGLASTGICAMQLGDPFPNEQRYADVVLDMETFETEKSNKKLNVRASEDTVARARVLYDNLNRFLDCWPGQVRAICMETLSLPRNAGASAKIGVALGVIVATAEQRRLAIVQAAPMIVKRAVCHKGTASKEEVIAAVKTLHHETVPMLDAMTKGRREHSADAVAIVRACFDSEIIRLIRGEA